MIYGITGASGVVGRRVSEILEKRGERVLLGSRSYTDTDKERHIDINDHDDVRSFIESCDIVINCAGPSMKTVRHLLPECIKQKKHYIDAFGWMPDLDKLQTDDSVVVLNAGTVPGLPGILAAYMKRYSPEELDIYSGGLEAGSRGSLGDMLETSINGYSRPGIVVEDDRPVKQMGTLKGEDTGIDGLSARCSVQPIITAEVEDIRNLLKYKNIKNYSIWPDENMKNILIEGCMRYMKAITEDERESVTEDILNKLRETSENKTPWYRLVIKAISDFETEIIDIKTEDSSVLTAAVICHIAEMIKEHRFKPGYYRPFELADGDRLLEEIRDAGIDLSLYGEI